MIIDTKKGTRLTKKLWLMRANSKFISRWSRSSKPNSIRRRD